MRFSSLVIAVLTTTSAMSAQAEGIDVNLSDDVVEAQLKNSLNLGNGLNRSDYQIGFLYKDDNRNSTMGMLGIEVHGPVAPNAPGLEVGAGVKAYLASVSEYDVGAITLGFMARYAVPAFERVTLTGRLNFAPDVTTFNDGQDFFYSSARVGYEFLSDVEIYLGYRDISVSLENGRDLAVDQGWFVGLDMALR